MDLTHVRRILHAIATVVVPDVPALDDRAWTEIEAVIARALARRGDRGARPLLLFVRLVQILAVARYGRSFTALPAHHRRAVLERLERSSLLVLRREWRSVRTLIFMGYYTRPEVVVAMGHRASAEGWAARGGTAASVPFAPLLSVEP